MKSHNEFAHSRGHALIIAGMTIDRSHYEDVASPAQNRTAAGLADWHSTAFRMPLQKFMVQRAQSLRYRWHKQPKETKSEQSKFLGFDFS
jgi:hypothetical protein